MIKGEIWTNNSEWNKDLMFTSNNGKHEGPVDGCPPYTAKLGVTACEVNVTKRGNRYVYHSEDE